MIKVIKLITNTVAWLQIAVSPSLLGGGLGAAIYFYHPGRLTLIAASVFCIIGFVTGTIWATKVHRRKGTVEFMARVIATPELNDSSGNS
jgi:VanZ family protein